MSKSISDLLTEGKDKSSVIETAVENFNKLIETEEFNALMEKLSILLSDSGATVVPSEAPIGGVKKKDILMAFGEHLMLLTDAQPGGLPPRFMLLSTELIPFLIKREGFGPREIIGLAASLLMNIVLSSYAAAEIKNGPDGNN